MRHYMDIPTELYEDDAVCYIASRYHVSTQEAVRGFLAQIGAVHGSMSDFYLEDNEIEIMKGLMDAYSSTKGEKRKYIE